MPATLTIAVAKAANGIALQLLDALLVASPTFQARVGAVDQATAAKHVFWPGMSGATEPDQRPHAEIFRMDNESRYKLLSGGDRNNLLPEGTLHLILCDNDRFEGDAKASLIDFENFAGGVLQDLADASAVDGNLSIVSMEEEIPPQYPALANMGALEGRPYWWTQWSIDWAAQVS